VYAFIPPVFDLPPAAEQVKRFSDRRDTCEPHEVLRAVVKASRLRAVLRLAAVLVERLQQIGFASDGVDQELRLQSSVLFHVRERNPLLRRRVATQTTVQFLELLF
jgi:hypothetical protein